MILSDELKALGGDESKYVVNHKDNNGLNNDISNLEWCSIKDNLEHAYSIGAKKTRAIARITSTGENRRNYTSIKSAVDELDAQDKNKSRKALEACLKSNSKKDIPTHQSQGFIWVYI